MSWLLNLKLAIVQKLVWNQTRIQRTNFIYFKTPTLSKSLLKKSVCTHDRQGARYTQLMEETKKIVPTY